MKKILIPTIILGTFLLVGCSKANDNSSSNQPAPDTHKVTKEQYDQRTYENAVANLCSQNYTVTYTEYYEGGAPRSTISKFDNGKIEAIPSSGSFYLDMKDGTYDPNNNTWSYDGYEYEDSQWTKTSYVDTLPDDIYFPDVVFYSSFEDLTYDVSSHTYKREQRVTESEDIFSNIEMQFEDGHPVYVTYDYQAHYELSKIYHTRIGVSNYGTTSVVLPNVE
jgi:major membrane immunogen (membrane-anchored lipoprotein)